MKKLLALLVMAVLSISAASAVVYPTWWENMGAGDQLTMGSYNTINAYADAGPGFDSKTATTNYVVTADSGVPGSSKTVISMVNGITTLMPTGSQNGEVYRQLLSQTGSASVYRANNPVYDPECKVSKITEVEQFQQEQVALFSGDIDCADKSFGATFSNNNVIGNNDLPGNSLHETSAALTTPEASVVGKGDDVHIIEAFAGQTTGGSLVETTSTVIDDADHLVKSFTMNGASSLFAGFDNAVLPKSTDSGATNYIAVKFNNGDGDKFWYED